MTAELLLLLGLISQATPPIPAPDVIIEIREPEYRHVSEKTYRFYCDDDTIDIRAYNADLGMRGNGSYISHVLFDSFPIPYDDLVAINKAIDGRVLRDIALTYCKSNTADHDSEINITLLPGEQSKAGQDSLTLRFLNRRLVTIWGGR